MATIITTTAIILAITITITTLGIATKRRDLEAASTGGLLFCGISYKSNRAPVAWRCWPRSAAPHLCLHFATKEKLFGKFCLDTLAA
jgi:hypothetical protein